MSKYLVTTGRKKYLLKGRNLPHNQAQAGVVICYEGWGARGGRYCAALKLRLDLVMACTDVSS